MDVLAWASTSTGSLNLVARAGCGKTSTLMLLCEQLARQPGTMFIGSYNKAIAEEIKAKLEAKGIKWPKATAGTMHGAGYSLWNKFAPKFRLEKNKVAKIFDRQWPMPPQSDWKATPPVERLYRDFVIKAVSLAKQRAFGVLCQVEDRKAWYDMIEHFGLDESLEDDSLIVEAGVELAIKVYRWSLNACREEVDFDDMILAPIYFKVPVRYPYDWVMIDEAQDTNPARRALALKILRPGGRLIAVGDDRQAIYGFTGADADSMDLIKASLNSKVLPLNVTYRCPKAVVALAQTWVPDITAHPSAPEGIVRTITLDEFAFEKLERTDAILCRKTAPLVDLAFSLLRRGIACKVEGKEIGEGLTKLARRWKVKTLEALTNRLNTFRDRETQKWLAKENEEKAAGVADRVDTLLVVIDRLLSEGKTEVTDLVSFLDGMFADDNEGILTLSTVHKSKGREWDRVYLLGRNAYMPSKWARKAWQLAQEDNLCYVAVTRAKRELVEIDVPIVKKEKAA
jgi:superfamily I DNA/RNA helicase